MTFTENKLKEFAMFVPQDDGSGSDWVKNLISDTRKDERERIKGVIEGRKITLFELLEKFCLDVDRARVEELDQLSLSAHLNKLEE